MLSTFLIIEQICIIVLESLLLPLVIALFSKHAQSSFAQYSEMLDSFHTLKIKS